MSPGPFKIILLILLILLLFGGGKIPSIMENLAKGIRSFKKGLKDEDLAEHKAIEDKKSNT